jgi:hypothetical protein
MFPCISSGQFSLNIMEHLLGFTSCPEPISKMPIVAFIMHACAAFA